MDWLREYFANVLSTMFFVGIGMVILYMIDRIVKFRSRIYKRLQRFNRVVKVAVWIVILVFGSLINLMLQRLVYQVFQTEMVADIIGHILLGMLLFFLLFIFEDESKPDIADSPALDEVRELLENSENAEDEQ